MKNSNGLRSTRNIMIACMVVTVLAAVPLWSRARNRTVGVATSVNIQNDSSREIRNVYSSHTDADDWSNDLLGDATIGAGQSYTVSGVQCDGSQVKIIAEDQDGCFETTVVSCGNSSSWTITNDTARDCGY